MEIQTERDGAFKEADRITIKFGDQEITIYERQPGELALQKESLQDIIIIPANPNRCLIK